MQTNNFRVLFQILRQIEVIKFKQSSNTLTQVKYCVTTHNLFVLGRCKLIFREIVTASNSSALKKRKMDEAKIIQVATQLKKKINEKLPTGKQNMNMIDFFLLYLSKGWPL